MSIVLALVIFSVIVIVHEFGHFLLAKCSGITVTEFSVGMGPRLLSHEWGGTRYSLKLLPFGGSCMMVPLKSCRPDSYVSTTPTAQTCR